MATYYVSTNGCDNNDGLTVNTPWKTIKKANETIKGGDTVSFKCGDVFYGRIYPPCKNDTLNATVYTSYGSGAKPVISQYKTANSQFFRKKAIQYRILFQQFYFINSRMNPKITTYLFVAIKAFFH
jgi:hypothetical protein